MAPRPGAQEEPGADRGQRRCVAFQALGAERPARPLVAAVKPQPGGAILEHQAVVAIGKGFGRRPVGKDDVVAVETKARIGSGSIVFSDLSYA